MRPTPVAEHPETGADGVYFSPFLEPHAKAFGTTPAIDDQESHFHAVDSPDDERESKRQSISGNRNPDERAFRSLSRPGKPLKTEQGGTHLPGDDPDDDRESHFHTVDDPSDERES